jgi:hypothetical protein
MAVIIREKKIIEGKEYAVKVYKTRPGKLVTEKEMKNAEQFDLFLSEKMREIEKKMKDAGFLVLKGKKGKVHRLWYEVGKQLEFVMDTSIVAAEDREYVWRAIYEHIQELHSGTIPERVKRDPETSHFSYCYKLSRFPWKFVNMAGDWTSWSEFFDRSETKNDPRIIEWLGKKAKESNVSGRQNWLRPLTKAIHKEFENRDTSVFSLDELHERLDKIFAEIGEDGQE